MSKFISISYGGTKSGIPYLSTEKIRKQVWEHIKFNAKQKNIFIDQINVHSDHCHCLISLGINQTISKVMQLIKGESSFWINQNKIVPRAKFEWQDEYYGISVSESMVERVRQYIRNQEEHHKTKTFQEECEELMKKFGFNRD